MQGALRRFLQRAHGNYANRHIGSEKVQADWRLRSGMPQYRSLSVARFKNPSVVHNEWIFGLGECLFNVCNSHGCSLPGTQLAPASYRPAEERMIQVLYVHETTCRLVLAYLETGKLF